MRRRFLKRRLYSTSTGFGSVPVAIARSAMRPAAERYFSINTGETVSTSAMLSKPSPESSVGKVPVGAELDRQQVADRVGVFGAIQAPGGDAARIGLHRRVRARELPLEQLHQRRDLLLRRLDDRIVGRHLLRLELRENQLPAIALGLERVDGSIEIDVEAARQVAGVVALAAGVVEQRPGRGGERCRARWPCCGARRRAPHRRQSRRRAGPRRPASRARAPAAGPSAPTT